MTFEEFESQYGLRLNDRQKTAVRTVEGPVLLLAVPGSGKTTVLIHRLAYMIYGRGIDPGNILVMTYTKAATKDMRERFVSYYGNEYADALEFRTINGVASKIISRFEALTGRHAFTLITDTQKQSRIISEAYRTVTDEYATEATVKTLLTAVSYIKNMMLTDEQIKKHDFDEPSTYPVYKKYMEILSERRLMDYDDQLVFSRKMLMSNNALLSGLREKFRYICVDEAQDTSKIQYEIIRLLALPRANLFMVGDEDQSIYGFRAAYPEALLGFETEYKGASVLKMEENYRSGAMIIKTADEYIQKNKKRHPKHIRLTRHTEGNVGEIEVYDRYGQYGKLTGIARSCTVETAALYRDNDSVIPLIDLLERENIPYRKKQLDSLFFSCKPVADITDLINLALSPSDGEAFMRVYYKLSLFINKLTAQAAVEYDRENGCGILNALILSGELNKKSLESCEKLIAHFKKLLTEPADRAVHRLTSLTGYADYLTLHPAFSGKTQILEMLGKNEPDVGGLLRRLNELDELISSDDRRNESNFILSTIHSSKGLEYDTVYMCDVIDGILPCCPKPTRKSSEAELAEYEEERRLFYVGMTRAKNSLYIFTFKKAELESLFSNEVFHKTKSAAKPAQTAYVRAEKSAKDAFKSKYTKTQIRRMCLDYGPGVPVYHKTFGQGVVININEDIILIKFPGVGMKSFSLPVMLSADIIKTI